MNAWAMVSAFFDTPYLRDSCFFYNRLVIFHLFFCSQAYRNAYSNPMALGIFTVRERKPRSNDGERLVFYFVVTVLSKVAILRSKCHERSKSDGEIVESSIVTKSRARARTDSSDIIAANCRRFDDNSCHRGTVCCLVYSRGNTDGEILHHNGSIICYYAVYRSSISGTCSSRTDFAIAIVISAFRITEPVLLMCC
jgi:hypothetical protein